MNAQMPREHRMSEDSRIVKLETQMGHVQSDVAELKGDVKWLVREFGSFRTEVATRFGTVDTRLESVNTSIERLNTEVATRFGTVDTRFESVNTSIERTNTSVERMNTAMERNTRWLMGTGVGALATLLGILGHALKWF